MVQREAVRLGVQFQVGGKWCSFVAVKDDNKESKSDSKGDTVVLTPPVEEDSDEDCGFGFFEAPAPAAPALTPTRSARQHGARVELFSGRGGVAGRGGRGTRRGGLASSFSGGPTNNSLGDDSEPFDATGGLGGNPGSGNTPFGASVHHPNSATFYRSSATPQIAMAPRKKKRMESAGVPPPPRGASYTSNARVVVHDEIMSYSRKGLGDDAPDPGTTPKLDTDNDKVHAVIEMQDFEGWWEQSASLLQILNVELTEWHGR
ncbi:MAG: hypothetical protein Q9224_007684, partial [Gallowayella concinna]